MSFPLMRAEVFANYEATVKIDREIAGCLSRCIHLKVFLVKSHTKSQELYLMLMKFCFLDVYEVVIRKWRSVGWEHDFFISGAHWRAILWLESQFAQSVKSQFMVQLSFCSTDERRCKTQERESDLALGKWLTAKSHSCYLDMCLLVIVAYCN